MLTFLSTSRHVAFDKDLHHLLVRLFTRPMQGCGPDPVEHVLTEEHNDRTKVARRLLGRDPQADPKDDPNRLSDAEKETFGKLQDEWVKSFGLPKAIVYEKDHWGKLAEAPVSFWGFRWTEFSSQGSQGPDVIELVARDYNKCHRIHSDLKTLDPAFADDYLISIVSKLFKLHTWPTMLYSTVKPHSVYHLAALAASSEIRRKPDWQKKVFDEVIVAKWEREAVGHDAEADEKEEENEDEDEDGDRSLGPLVTPSSWSWIVSQIRYLAKEKPDAQLSAPTSVPNVFASFDAIPTSITAQLKQGAIDLAKAQGDDKDWHPGSNNTVLDLVHPSLYPFVRGRTAVKQREPAASSSEQEFRAQVKAGLDRFEAERDPSLFKGLEVGVANTVPSKESLQILPGFVKNFSGRAWDDKWNADRFLWLPTDFQVSEEGKFKARNYINNLHPRHTELYQAIEGVLEHVLPLFEDVITSFRAGRSLEFWAGAEPDFELAFDPPGPKSQGILERMDDTYYDKYDEWCKRSKTLVAPVVGNFVPPANRASLKGMNLQVITKIASVELTPDNPQYEGGSWHVEGTPRENIVATAIYYFDSVNIEDPMLDFRHAIDSEEMEGCFGQEQYDHFCLLTGIENDRLAVQDLGGVATPGGACIAFPNGFQHRLRPFGLLDKEQPGHRKMLVFFLVNPSWNNYSTCDVPAQQLDWIVDEIQTRAGSSLSSVPTEVQEQIVGYAAGTGAKGQPGPMKLEEARELRLELMEKRAIQEDDEEDFIDYIRGGGLGATFSFCEH